ncbi:MAG: RdgB/HAM1 family non-canonical purine NTP pyrophosphatase [Lachnospiraceae bacterium]|nr:RdgB/HAM1 family non-canonical purine NTP pyrophosphatase [Lachnospiraceae bacterium]
MGEKTKRIIFATGNEDKLREIRMILEDTDVEIVSMREAGIDADIVEDGATFEENAAIKAKAVMERSGEMVLADDSGLEIDFLDRAPGVYSARFMGTDTSYEIKNNAILETLSGVPDEKRSARFVCAIVCALPDGRLFTCRETMEGRIGYEIRGGNGFGYDPIFYLPECGCYSAELAPEKKNELSHRGKALRSMRDLLRRETII